MRKAMQFFIDGEWVEPSTTKSLIVTSPVTEKPIGAVALGGLADVNRAVSAAMRAQILFSRTTRGERLELLASFLAEYTKRESDLVDTICEEIGAPYLYAKDSQVNLGRVHLEGTIKALRSFEFEIPLGTARVVREPIGVSALITAWNFPLGLIVTKVASAIAAGCSCVLKPSELTPFSAAIVAEILSSAGFPRGVFNLVYGLGPDVGECLAAHPDVRMVSITGSNAAGVRVAEAAAATVKRVHQELGGKSANIILDDADLDLAMDKSVAGAFRNSGQSCSAPTRLLVPRTLLSQVEDLAKAKVERLKMGAPKAAGTTHGPVISRRQFESIQEYIASAISEGAKIVTGGAGRPDHLDTGFFVRPTVLSGVTKEMLVAKEEIFGPVLVIIPYESEDDAVMIANSTKYGLAAYVQSTDIERARNIARRLEAGTVHINFPAFNNQAPFGGWKQSGNGREYGRWGIEEYLETKSITGYETFT